MMRRGSFADDLAATLFFALFVLSIIFLCGLAE